MATLAFAPCPAFVFAPVPWLRCRPCRGVPPYPRLLSFSLSPSASVGLPAVLLPVVVASFALHPLKILCRPFISRALGVCEFLAVRKAWQNFAKPCRIIRGFLIAVVPAFVVAPLPVGVVVMVSLFFAPHPVGWILWPRLRVLFVERFLPRLMLSQGVHLLGNHVALAIGRCAFIGGAGASFRFLLVKGPLCQDRCRLPQGECVSL